MKDRSKCVSNGFLFAIGWKEPPLLGGGAGGRSDHGEQMGKGATSPVLFGEKAGLPAKMRILDWSTRSMTSGRSMAGSEQVLAALTKTSPNYKIA